MFKDIEIVCVHYNTARLLLKMRASVRLYLGNVKIRVLDSSDSKKERRVLKAIDQADPFFTVEFHKEKIQKGMDLGIKTSLYPYVLIISPNIKIKREGLIEEMRKYIRDAYGVGHVTTVQGIPFLHSMCMMINKKEYLKWPPLEDGNFPSMKAMVALAEANKSGNVIKLKDVKSYWIQTKI